MRYLVLLLASGCWWAPCPTEGSLEVLAVDADGAPVCIDEITVTDPDGSELTATCDCGRCTVDTLLEGEHEAVVTVGEETQTGTADLIVFERCNTPDETIELTFAAP